MKSKNKISYQGETMKKFRVIETNITSYVYEVEAEDECEAEDKVRTGEAEHLSEYDSHDEKKFECEEIKKEKTMKAKTIVDVGKLIRLRNLVLTAIDITKEDMNKHKEGTSSYSYSLGMLHCQKDFKDKLNALIAMG